MAEPKNTTTEPKPEVKAAPVPPKSEKQKKVEELEKQCAEILKEYGGMEGNVPTHHSYWGLRNAIRNELSKG